MHFSFLYVCLLAVILPAVQANFDVYYVRQVTFQSVGTVTLEGFQIHGNDPSRNDVETAKFWRKMSDVSGSKTGVACDGSGCSLNGEPGNIDRLEMNFGVNPTWHWTIYKDRGLQMYGLDGNTYGNCILFPGVTWSYQFSFINNNRGSRLFRCLTKYTVNDIYGRS